jgi:hypothetical protein
VKAAKPKLLELLAKGVLLIWAFEENGESQKVPFYYWEHIGAPQAWTILWREQGTASLYVPQLITWRPAVFKIDLNKILPMQPEETTIKSSKAKGGRPTEHDWTAIWVEMCAYIDREDVPDSYAVLTKFIQDWIETTDLKSPQPSELHKRAKALIDRLRSDQGRSPIT